MTKPQTYTFAEADFYFEYYKPEEVDQQIQQLRGNLSLAEEGLANAMQEIERLQRALAETHDAWTAETQRRVQAEAEVERLNGWMHSHPDGRYNEYHGMKGQIERLQRELAETRKGEAFSDRVAIHWQTKAATQIERLERIADQLDEWIDDWRNHFEPGYTTVEDLREIAKSLRATVEFRESRGENPAQGPVPAASSETLTARLSDEPSERRVTTVGGIESMGYQGRHYSGLDTDDRLSKCPFCGHDAAVRVADHGVHGSPGHDKFQLSVECTNTSCGVKTPEHYATREKAIEAWNRRTEKSEGGPVHPNSGVPLRRLNPEGEEPPHAQGCTCRACAPKVSGAKYQPTAFDQSCPPMWDVPESTDK